MWAPGRPELARRGREHQHAPDGFRKVHRAGGQAPGFHDKCPEAPPCSTPGSLLGGGEKGGVFAASLPGLPVVGGLLGSNETLPSEPASPIPPEGKISLSLSLWENVNI